MTQLLFLPAPARDGSASLRVATAAGTVWVHSPVDPRREAERQLDALALDSRALLVVVGGGLGWLARAALVRECAGVLVLEPDAEALGLCDTPAENERRAGAAEELIAWVTTRQMALGWPDLAVLHNPAYGRAFPDWAARLLEALPPGRRPSRLGARLVDDLRWPPRRVLLLDSGYYLLREIREALVELGIDVLSVPLVERSAGDPGLLAGPTRADAGYAERLLQAVADGRPDLALAVNHLGLDREGRIQDLLASLGVPLAVWYVDSPEYILEDAPSALCEESHLFCWERAWIPRLESLGFPSVTHLPLAGSPGFARASRPRRDFSLVAGSNAGALAKWRGKLACPRVHGLELEALLAEASSFPVHELPEAELERRLMFVSPAFRAWLDPARRRCLASLLVLMGTQQERLALARAFRGRDFALHGDAGWRGLRPGLPPSPPLDYYGELADHYASTRLSLNATSRQMPGTVNQRLFDAPLAGSLVLSDRRADLTDFLEPGREVLVYHDVAQAPEIGLELTRDEPRRRAMVEAARLRIRSGHLYTHRLRAMLDGIGARLGTRRQPARSAASVPSRQPASA